MSGSGSQHKRQRNNADSPFRYGEKNRTNHLIFKMPDSNKIQSLRGKKPVSPNVSRKLEHPL